MEESLKELPWYDRHGKPVYRLCGTVLYDYMGKPRGFVVGKAIYDLRAQHRGFLHNRIVWDRMCRVLGYADDARLEGLSLPPVDIPPVPYKNLPAPEPPAEAVDRACTAFIPVWSMMRLDNLLPT